MTAQMDPVSKVLGIKASGPLPLIPAVEKGLPLAAPALDVWGAKPPQTRKEELLFLKKKKFFLPCLGYGTHLLRRQLGHSRAAGACSPS